MTTAGFIDHVRSQHRGYLSLHPEDSERLSGLARLLETGSAGMFSRSSMDGHLTASMMVLDHAVQSAVLVSHPFLGRLLQPGGHIQGLTTIYHSAFGEAVEETGIRGAVPYGSFDADGMSLPIDVDSHAIPANPVRSEGDHVHHDFCYACVGLMPRRPYSEHPGQEPARAVPLDEIAAMPDERLARLARRIMAIRDARRG